MAPLLLTGAGGYLGAAIAAALRRAGIGFEPLAGRLESLEAGALSRHATVIHAAGAIRRRGVEAADPVNRVGTERLAAALGSSARVLYLSTRCVYGHRPGASVSEMDTPHPADAYGKSKLAAEQLLMERFPASLVLRIPGMIGDSPAGIGHAFLAEALRAFLAGRPLRRFVPDRDHDNLDVAVLAATCTAWARDPGRFPTGPCNLAGPRRSLHATLDAFARAAQRHGGTLRIEDVDAPPMPWPWLDDRRLRAAVDVPGARDDYDLAVACCARLAAEGV